MICRVSGQQFDLNEAELNCIQTLYSAHPLLCKEPIAYPDTAPQEFLRQIGAWGNLLNIFKTKSSFSDKPQISRYNPELGYKVCTPDEFWSEEIDNLDFGRAFDFSRPFFDQFNELLMSVYLVPLNASNCEGSSYINGAYGTKDSYLCFGIFNSQDCLYDYMARNCADCLDCVELLQSNFCYDCHSITDCYECRHSNMCKGCSGCIFCVDCIGSQNCIFSYGLRNAKYCIENQQVSKLEYENYLSKLELHKRSAVERAKLQFDLKFKQAAYSANTLINTINSSGHFITNSENVTNSFYIHDAKDCGHLMLSNNCLDFWRGFSEGAELGYQSGGYLRAYCTYNSYMIVSGSFNLYSTFLYNSCNHCFGSAGLNKKSYCILNKEYSKEEYFDLVPRIISHMKGTNEWGRFFPAAIAPHYYEDSFGNDWIEPIALSEAVNRGYRVKGFDVNLCNQVNSKLSIPDSINDVEENILEQTFNCSVSGKTFRIQKKELEFYRRFGIPIPELHWKNRINNRISEVFLIPRV